MVSPVAKRQMGEYLQQSYQISVRRACLLVSLCRSMWYYKSQKDDTVLINKLGELADQFPTRGFDNYYGRLCQQGYPWSRNKVLRVYRLMKLGLRRKHKKRLPSRIKEPLQVPKAVNTTWSIDFMSDSLTDGRRIRVLNITDDFNREALGIEAGLSFPADRVVRVLTRLEEEVGLPSNIRVDNGPEFISKTLRAWCERKNITLKYIQPGKPVQNAFIERFNRIFREDVLDAYWFDDLEQLRIIIEKWRYDYNHNHPHSSLGGVSPITYLTQAVNSGKVSPRNPGNIKRIKHFSTINSYNNSNKKEKC